MRCLPLARPAELQDVRRDYATEIKVSLVDRRGDRHEVYAQLQGATRCLVLLGNRELTMSRKAIGLPEKPRRLYPHETQSQTKVRGADTAPIQLEPSYRRVNRNRRPNATWASLPEKLCAKELGAQGHVCAGPVA